MVDNDLLMSIYKKSPVGIVMYDSSGCFVDANDACKNILGIENIQEYKEIKLFNAPFVDSEIIEKIHKSESLNYEAVVDFKKINDKRLYKTVKSGKVHISVTFTLVNHAAADKEISYLFQMQEIAGRKTASTAVRDGEERLNDLINASPFDILCFKDGFGRWLVANQAGLELFRLAGVDYYMKKDSELADYTHPVYRDVLIKCGKFDENVWHSGGIARYEETVVSPDGDPPRIFDIVKIPLFNEDGSRKGMAMFGHDITARKSAEAELEKAISEAKKTSKIKNTFMANMSHEIRTPINGIIGFANMMAASGLNENQQKYIDIINAATRNLMKIVNDILDLSKIENESFQLNEELFSLHDMLEHICFSFHRKAEKKSLILRYEIDENTPEVITSDRMRLEQVLSYLIDNAIKFTKKGEVGIRIKETPSSNGCRNVRFEVYDTGIGISQERINELLGDSIYRDISSTKKYEGAGLGLIIVKKLLNMMNGTFEIVSVVSSGSSFIFEIPLENKTKTAFKDEIHEGLAKFRANGGSGWLKTLAVEDNWISRKLLEELFKRNGWEIDVAEDGSSAFEKYKKNNYDVVLMDIQLPDINGYEVTRQIREYEKQAGKHSIIIALTAYAMESDMKRCFDSGMDAYLSKPLDIDELIEKISAIRKK